MQDRRSWQRQVPKLVDREPSRADYIIGILLLVYLGVRWERQRRRREHAQDDRRDSPHRVSTKKNEMAMIR